MLLTFSLSVINAENAAHKSEKFSTMATRTRHEYLKDLATNYITNITLDAGSSKSSFGKLAAVGIHILVARIQLFTLNVLLS